MKILQNLVAEIVQLISFQEPSNIQILEDDQMDGTTDSGPVARSFLKTVIRNGMYQ